MNAGDNDSMLMLRYIIVMQPLTTEVSAAILRIVWSAEIARIALMNKALIEVKSPV